MYSFYRYSEVVFQDNGVRERIKEQEFHSLLATALPYLTVDPERPQGPQDFFKEKIHEKVANDIDSGLAVLRRQILEGTHSIFEKYLCHVVRVYLHTFPELLMDIDKQVPFRTVAELRGQCLHIRSRRGNRSQPFQQAKLKGKERLPRETTETHPPRRSMELRG